MQARLAVVMGLTTAVWGPVFVLVYLAAAMPWAAAVVAAGTVYLLTVPWVLRVTESTEVAGHHTASALWFVIVGLSVFTGGIESTAPPWLVACGFLGMAVGGWRPGVLWLILSLVTYVGLALGHVAGVPYGEAPESVSLWLRTTGARPSWPAWCWCSSSSTTSCGVASTSRSCSCRPPTAPSRCFSPT